MLTDKIMHGGVIRVLLNDQPTHLDLEALCKLFSTMGKLLEDKYVYLCRVFCPCHHLLIEHSGSFRSQAGLMEQYFKRLKLIGRDEQYPSRIRFMIQDVIELRYALKVSFMCLV